LLYWTFLSILYGYIQAVYLKGQFTKNICQHLLTIFSSAEH